jgi:uncharacterized membrane protein YqjE
MGEHAMVQTESARSAGGAADPSLGDLVALAVKDLTKLVKWEIDLAKVELKADLRRVALSVVLIAGSAVAGFLVLVLLSFGLVYGLMRLGIWPWASFLIVAGVDVVLIGIATGFVFINVRRLTGLAMTRKTVQQDLAIMRRDDEATAAPAVEAR